MRVLFLSFLSIFCGGCETLESWERQARNNPAQTDYGDRWSHTDFTKSNPSFPQAAANGAIRTGLDILKSAR